MKKSRESGELMIVMAAGYLIGGIVFSIAEFKFGKQIFFDLQWEEKIMIPVLMILASINLFTWGRMMMCMENKTE